MTALATALKQEISRLARKESRAQISATKKAATRHRREIAQLKREIAELSREVKTLRRRADRNETTPAARAESGKQLRFSSAWLKKHRERVQLSAADYGRLVGVSGMSIYNWESDRTKPREKQLAALAAVRPLGKREAWRKLDELDS